MIKNILNYSIVLLFLFSSCNSTIHKSNQLISTGKSLNKALRSIRTIKKILNSRIKISKSHDEEKLEELLATTLEKTTYLKIFMFKTSLNIEGTPEASIINNCLPSFSLFELGEFIEECLYQIHLLHNKTYLIEQLVNKFKASSLREGLSKYLSEENKKIYSLIQARLVTKLILVIGKSIKKLLLELKNYDSSNIIKNEILDLENVFDHGNTIKKIFNEIPYKLPPTIFSNEINPTKIPNDCFIGRININWNPTTDAVSWKIVELIEEAFIVPSTPIEEYSSDPFRDLKYKYKSFIDLDETDSLTQEELCIYPFLEKNELNCEILERLNFVFKQIEILEKFIQNKIKTENSINHAPGIAPLYDKFSLDIIGKCNPLSFVSKYFLGNKTEPISFSENKKEQKEVSQATNPENPKKKRSRHNRGKNKERSEKVLEEVKESEETYFFKQNENNYTTKIIDSKCEEKITKEYKIPESTRTNISEDILDIKQTNSEEVLIEEETKEFEEEFSGSPKTETSAEELNIKKKEKQDNPRSYRNNNKKGSFNTPQNNTNKSGQCTNKKNGANKNRENNRKDNKPTYRPLIPNESISTNNESSSKNRDSKTRQESQQKKHNSTVTHESKREKPTASTPVEKRIVAENNIENTIQPNYFPDEAEFPPLNKNNYEQNQIIEKADYDIEPALSRNITTAVAQEEIDLSIKIEEPVQEEYNLDLNLLTIDELESLYLTIYDFYNEKFFNNDNQILKHFLLINKQLININLLGKNELKKLDTEFVGESFTLIGTIRSMEIARQLLSLRLLICFKSLFGEGDIVPSVKKVLEARTFYKAATVVLELQKPFANILESLNLPPSSYYICPKTKKQKALSFNINIEEYRELIAKELSQYARTDIDAEILNFSENIDGYVASIQEHLKSNDATKKYDEKYIEVPIVRVIEIFIKEYLIGQVPLLLEIIPPQQTIPHKKDIFYEVSRRTPNLKENTNQIDNSNKNPEIEEVKEKPVNNRKKGTIAYGIVGYWNERQEYKANNPFYKVDVYLSSDNQPCIELNGWLYPIYPNTNGINYAINTGNAIFHCKPIAYCPQCQSNQLITMNHKRKLADSYEEVQGFIDDLGHQFIEYNNEIHNVIKSDRGEIIYTNDSISTRPLLSETQTLNLPPWYK